MIISNSSKLVLPFNMISIVTEKVPTLVKCQENKSANAMWLSGMRMILPTLTSQNIEEIRGSSHYLVAGSISSLTFESRIWPRWVIILRTGLEGIHGPSIY